MSHPHNPPPTDVAVSNSERDGNEQRMRCMKQDVIALVLAILIFVIVVILALVSTIPALGAPPLPSFEDPIKGFEPRGTVLSNRINAVRLLLKSNSELTTNTSPKQQINSSILERKRRSNVGINYCPSQYYIRVAFQSTSSSSLFTAENMKSMCYLEKKIMKSSPTRFNDYYYENCPDCCESISLGGFIAKFRSKKTCADITDEDVNGAMKIIQSCSVYFVQGLLKQSCSCDNINEKFSPNCPSVPCVCSWKSAVYLALNELTDSEFLKTPSQTNLKYSAILSPIKWSSYDLFNNIYETHLKDSLPEYKGVKVAGFDFGNFRFDLFNVLLVENAKYPAIAMVFVLIIMCFFLKSIILSFCALLTILFALVLSYFLYNVVFGIKFFPFLNVITLVFLVGIGADDAFVYYDIFRQTKSANPNDGVLTLTLKTLRYAALSMFVTSFTTSAAFFANLSSHITSIRLFGIYAGLSILTNYLLMITWFPIIVVLHERWVRKRKADQIVQPTKEQKEGGRFEEMGNNPHGTPSCEEIDRDGKGTVHLTAQYSSGREEAKERSLACLICWGIDFPCHFIARSNTFFSSMSHKLFETWLPSAVIKKRLYLVWIFLFVGLTVGFLCVSFVSPKLKLPTSKGFQVFSSSSSIEQYNLHIEQKFRYAHKNAGGLWVELVWGLKPLDNGNYLNPDEKGTLQYDDSFDPVFTAASQKWLSSFCKSLASQPFYTNTSWAGGSLCRMEEVIRICSPPSKHACCGNATFPYPKNVIENCKVHTATPDIYYDIQSGKARAMRMYFSSNVAWTAEYEKMDTFWNQLDSWSKKQFSEAPSTFKNGWIVCRNLDSMYSLQYSLQKGTISSMGISIAIAFGVMLLTTLNIFISVYAIITIIGIIAITIGCLVLLGWQLSVLESIVMSVSVGLSIDFTMHYGVAYRLSPHKDNRQERVRYSFIHIGSAILMAAVTTFVTGALMMPAIVLVYIQLGQFLMLVMVFSWLYATFAFLSLCAVIGPTGNFGQLSITNICRKIGLCKVKPEDDTMIKDTPSEREKGETEFQPNRDNNAETEKPDGSVKHSMQESHL